MQIDFHARLEEDNVVVTSLRGRFNCSPDALMDEVLKRAKDGAKLRIYNSSNQLLSIATRKDGLWTTLDVPFDNRRKPTVLASRLFFHSSQ